MIERKKLTDILRGAGSGDNWINNDNWDNIPPAPDFRSPIPKGSYVTHVIDGALFEARTTGTPGYKVTHEIIEGDYKGRRLWHDIWLSDAAKNGAVRDLAKLGIRSKAQLEQPIPSRRIRCKVFVVLRKADDGSEWNEVRSFEFLGIDPPQLDVFAPEKPPQPGPLSPGNIDTPPRGNKAVTNNTKPPEELFSNGANVQNRGPYQEGF